MEHRARMAHRIGLSIQQRLGSAQALCIRAEVRCAYPLIVYAAWQHLHGVEAEAWRNKGQRMFVLLCE